MRRNMGIAGLLTLVVLLAVGYTVLAKGSTQRPFKAQSSEVVVSEGVVEGSTCPVFEVNSEGSGTGTHIGSFTVVRRINAGKMRTIISFGIPSYWPQG